MNYVALSWLGLAAAAVLIIINGVLSFTTAVLSAACHRGAPYACAARRHRLRLKFIFDQSSPLVTAAFASSWWALLDTGVGQAGSAHRRLGGVRDRCGHPVLVGLFATVYNDRHHRPRPCYDPLPASPRQILEIRLPGSRSSECRYPGCKA